MNMNKYHFESPEIPHIDKVGIEERVARLNSRCIKKDSKLSALKLALSMIDLTTLEGKDTPGKVKQLCTKAIHLHDALLHLPSVAAVCVYPRMVRYAKDFLQGTNIHIASVATYFPSGMNSLQSRLEEIRFAIDEGADEVDMVISRGKFLQGEYQTIFDEVSEAKHVCGDVHLKVILETGELRTLQNVRIASDLAMSAGADFIKTSTGKVQPAATQPVTLVMLEAIRNYYRKTGRRVGMKPAGGISDAKTAIRYLVMVRETLGPDWLIPGLFRFGASSLANDLLQQIVKQLTGVYQSPDYFSKD